MPRPPTLHPAQVGKHRELIEHAKAASENLEAWAQASDEERREFAAYLNNHPMPDGAALAMGGELPLSFAGWQAERRIAAMPQPWAELAMDLADEEHGDGSLEGLITRLKPAAPEGE